MKKYKILRCPNCFNFLITSSLTSFKCQYCFKVKSVKKLRVFFESENPNLATKTLQSLKKEFADEKFKDVEFKSL